MAETLWQAPVVEDLCKVLSAQLQLASNENLPNPSQDLINLINTPYDPDQPDRRGAALTFAQTEFYNAIVVGNRVLPSTDNTTLPPEVIRACLQWAAYNLLVSDVNLKSVIVTENGVYTPYNTLQKESQAWLNKLRAGFIVTAPSSPVTAVAGQADGGTSGDITGNYDMTWDGNVVPTPLQPTQ